jgi:hypothetical protein
MTAVVTARRQVEQMRDAAAVGAEPETAVLILRNGVDGGVVEAVGRSVIHELMTVEPAEPFQRAEPQVSLPVLMDHSDAALNEPVSYTIVTKRQTFGGGRKRSSNEKRRQQRGE